MGQPDESTAQALRDAIGDAPLRCVRWVGYGEVPTSNRFASVKVDRDLLPGSTGDSPANTKIDRLL